LNQVGESLRLVDISIVGQKVILTTA